MQERWRKPLTVLDVEDGDEAFLTSDGRVFRSKRITYDRESTERIRSGYACAKCMEPFEQAWPERCPECGAPIASRAAEYFNREYAGFEHIGPRTSLADDLAGLHERAERQRREEQ
jgi:hypothetical protein